MNGQFSQSLLWLDYVMCIWCDIVVVFVIVGNVHAIYKFFSM